MADEWFRRDFGLSNVLTSMWFLYCCQQLTCRKPCLISVLWHSCGVLIIQADRIDFMCQKRVFLEAAGFQKLQTVLLSEVLF